MRSKVSRVLQDAGHDLGDSGQPGTLMIGLSLITSCTGVARVGLAGAACTQPQEELPEGDDRLGVLGHFLQLLEAGRR